MKKLIKNIKRGTLLKVSLNYLRKKFFPQSVNRKTSAVESPKILSPVTESAEDAIAFLAERIQTIVPADKNCLHISSGNENAAQLEFKLKEKLKIINLLPDALTSLSEKEIQNTACIFTSIFEASKIHEIGKKLISSPILKDIPFEYVCIPKEEYSALNRFDHYNKNSFVSPLLSSSVPFNSIYENSIPKFNLDTPLFEYTAKCDVRDFMDLNQLITYVVHNQVDGDIAEFGSYKGHSGFLMTEILKSIGSEKMLYMFDTFEEFPSESIGIDSFWSNTHQVDFEEVRSKLEPQGNAILVKGDFTETLPKTDIKRLSMAYVDCDSYRATEFLNEYIFENILSPGGLMVFEDYGHPALLGNRLSIHKFFDGRKDCFKFFSQFSGYYVVLKLV